MTQYKKEKIKLLKDFAINLKENEIAYLMGLETEIAVDNYVKQLFLDRLG